MTIKTAFLSTIAVPACGTGFIAAAADLP